jgi:hypothetical protein
VFFFAFTFYHEYTVFYAHFNIFRVHARERSLYYHRLISFIHIDGRHKRAHLIIKDARPDTITGVGRNVREHECSAQRVFKPRKFTDQLRHESTGIDQCKHRLRSFDRELARDQRATTRGGFPVIVRRRRTANPAIRP